MHSVPSASLEKYLQRCSNGLHTNFCVFQEGEAERGISLEKQRESHLVIRGGV